MITYKIDYAKKKGFDYIEKRAIERLEKRYAKWGRIVKEVKADCDDHWLYFRVTEYELSN